MFFIELINLFLASYSREILSHRHTNLPLVVGGGQDDEKGGEVACSPGLSGSIAPALLFVEGR